MSLTVCLFGNSLYYPQGGGHLWVALNWALGFRAAGCRVIWLEGVGKDTPAEQVRTLAHQLTERLARYGITDALSLCPWFGEPPLATEAVAGCLPFEQAGAESDLLINLGYGISEQIVGAFRRKALVDIDPGLLQVWMSHGGVTAAKHDIYFSIGETVGQPGALFPDMGIQWNYTPPCVALDAWPVRAAAAEAPFTTVSQWRGGDWIVFNGESYANDKRTGFVPYLDLPSRTRVPIELAINLSEYEQDQRELLLGKGWRVRQSHEVASTPWDYQAYLQNSRGEFSCAKPSCAKLQNAWISDRTICYMASGKPAVVEHSGPSRFLPDDAGLFRFRNLDEAARYLDTAAADPEKHGRLARALVEEYFDATKVTRRLLERAIV